MLPKEAEKLNIEKPELEGRSTNHNPVFEEDQVRPISLRKLFKYADWRDWLLMISGGILAGANGITMPLFSIVLGDLFDDFGTAAPAGDEHYYRDKAAVSARLFGYIAVLAFFGSFAQLGFFTISAERQTLRIRQHYLRAVLDQEIAWFDARQSGELSARISENTVIIKESMGDKLGNLFQFAFMFIGGFVVGFYFSWELTLIICCIAPFLALGGFLMMQAMVEMTGKSLTAYAKAGSIVEETLSNLRTVTAFNAQDKIIEAYDQKLIEAEKNGIKKASAQGFGMGFVMFAMFCSYSLAFFYGSYMIERGRNDAFHDHPFSAANQACQDLYNQESQLNQYSQIDFCASASSLVPFFDNSVKCDCGCSHPDSNCLTGGDVLLVFFSVLMGSFALGQAAPSLSALNNGRMAAAKIFSIIEREPMIESPLEIKNAPLENPEFSGTIVLKDIKFAYPTRKAVTIFKQLNLTIPMGKSTALVGGSGCGKSTVMALIQRYYDPDEGAVFIEGKDYKLHNLKTLNLSKFRDQLGLVSQEPVLFATTIAKNISYGAKLGESASFEAIVAAAKAANAYDFIMSFPKQFDTLVGARGAQLSGGQKQRIAIARAMLRNPTFLLLDEATSALDNESEKIVQKALDELLVESSRTTIVIAHRLSTIRNCDNIVVLGEGRLIEQGTHDQLLSLPNGTYSMLVSAANKSQENGEANSDDIKDVIERISSSGGNTRLLSSSKAESSKSFKQSKVLDAESTPIDDKITVAPAEELYTVPFSRILSLSKPEKWVFIPAVISAAINGVQMPVFALFFGKLSVGLYKIDTDDMRENGSLYAWAFFGLAVAIGLANWVQFITFGYIAEKLTRRVRKLLFSSLLKMEMGFFDESKHSVGALSSGLSTDAALVKANVADRLSLAIMNLTTIVGGLVIAFVNGWQLTLVLLAVFPIVAGAGAAQMIAMTMVSKDDDRYMAPAASVLQESVAGIRTVTAFNSKKRVLNLYQEYLAVPMQLGTKKGIIVGSGFGISNGVIFGLYAVAFLLGGIFIDREVFDFEQMVISFFAVTMTAMGLGQSMGLTPDIAKGSVAVSNVFRIVDRASKIDPTLPVGEKQIRNKEYSVDLKNLKFAYPARPDAQVFANFSLHIEPGKTVALVGSSGSGKSTVIALLERFYDPASGSITIGHSDKVSSLNLSWWRNQIGLVEQEPKLFATSIKENIRYGAPHGVTVTDNDIIAAAKSANAHDFIMEFPNNYDTLVGEQGAQLSGGQKQRICLARAILRRPKVLLLDEATSALDNKSEKIVQAALDKFVQEGAMTTIVVAHRLTTIQNADKIVVIAHGEVVEEGKHAELLALQGTYFKLWNTQSAGH